VIIRRLSFLAARGLLRVFRPERPRAVFIIGHMRSGSTLLLHILLTTPEIIACGERNAPYDSPADLDKLEIFARMAQRAPLRPVRFAADQINHDHLTPSAGLLRSERVRCLFIVREPDETIRSILALTRTYYTPWSARRAVDYYCSRLETLAGCAAAGMPFEAVTYSDLVDNTSATLRRIESFLGLERRLSESYTVQRFTGERGDPSNRIFRGTIVRERAAASCEIPKEELERARQAYARCAAALKIRR
jgi:hypothetical protein